MRIAFLLPGNVNRSGQLSGYNIRYGGTASSGTESSVIYVAEYLAEHGYEVVVSSEGCEHTIIDKNVTYTNYNFDYLDNKNFDILISCLWFENYDTLPITVNLGVIYWYHLAWGYSLVELRNYAIKNKLKVGAVSVSKWAKKYNQEFNNILKVNNQIIEVIIPNPVAIDIVNEVLNEKIGKKNRKFIFHAQWSRGGDVAKKACNEIGWSDLEFESFDYVHKATGIDKKTLFNKINNSEYFVFPQLTHGKLVYKDTFSLSVAEAIALGVTVITYPLGALPEYFGEFCEFLEYPPEVNIDSLENDRVSEEPKLDYTKNIIEKLNFLDSNPSYKNEKREKGIEYIRDNFSINKIGPMWVDFLDNFK